MCLVDLDPQASATRVLLQDEARVRDLGERLAQGKSLTALKVPCAIQDLSIVGSGELLSVYESQILADPLGVTKVARSLGSLHGSDVDLIIVDTPPSLGPFTFGALMSARWALIPTVCEDSSIRTLSSALRTVSETKIANAELRVLAIVANRYERNTRHGVTALETIRAAFNDHLAATVLPKAAAIAEAFQPGLPIDHRTPAYKTVVALAEELIERLQRPTPDSDGVAALEEGVSACNAVVGCDAGIDCEASIEQVAGRVRG